MNFSYYASIHAQTMPNKVCLIERSPEKGTRRTLTWKEFNDRVNGVANYLRNQFHISKGDFVLHLQNNSLEWLITYYAIIRIGATVVPLNFRFIGEDIKYAASVCDPVAFILGSEFLERVLPIKPDLKSINNYVVVGDVAPSGMERFSELEKQTDVGERIQDMAEDESLALMFTSGTTGKPKPVLHTHGSINAVAVGNAITFSVGRNDNYIGFFPLYHAGTMFYMTAYYITGSTATLLTEIKDPKWIIETVEQERGTDLMLVVPVAISIINAVKNGDIDLKSYDLSCWRMLEIGAQPVPFDILKDLAGLLPCGVIVAYGITEGGGGSTVTLYPEDLLKKPGSIGKPNFCVECKLVDEKGNRVGPGMVGEILLKTPRNMKEYYKNPDLTAQTIKDGYLYTGDLATTDGDSYYYIVDRKKDMICSGGENIYPVEIEEVLHDHEKIEDAAVIGFPDDRLVEIVMAVVQLRKGESMTEAEVNEFCKSRLALYKVPRKVVFDVIPRSATGKILKPELRERYTGRRQVVQT